MPPSNGSSRPSFMKKSDATARGRNPNRKPNLVKESSHLLKIDSKSIENKHKKREVIKKQEKLKKILKNQARKQRRKDGVPAQAPITQEDKREKDDAIVKDEHVEEIKEEEEYDEFAEYFKSDVPPKVLITTAWDAMLNKAKVPGRTTRWFIKELLECVPNSSFFTRRKYYLKQIIEFCKKKDFTDILVVGERNSKPYSMIMIHLPDGPTATFRLSTTRTSKYISNRAKSSTYYPELILNNFTTRLGYRMARMFSAIFPQKPEFTGRRVVTLHCQRDFLFFRHHRYEFEDHLKSVRIQEIGPQVTFRLKSLQLGTFDTQFGEYEWFHRKELDTSRRRFFM
ncbi:Brix domain-containing protein [Acrasis kona]|uniref:Brix domain-containing protein n=1 Tax=Acrasis kona TaxID=1008807 RepID=A0AAW2ZNY6_9EUKA